MREIPLLKWKTSLLHLQVLCFQPNFARMERGAQLAQVLGCVLARLVASNDAVRGTVCTALCLSVGCERVVTALQLPAESQRITKFHALRAPGISVKDYLER